MTQQNEQKFIRRDRVDSRYNFFPLGLKTDKAGKTVYLSKVKTAEGKVDYRNTKVLVTMCLPARKEHEKEASAFLDLVVSLEDINTYKEKGVDLTAKSNTPVKIAYEWTTTNKQDENGVWQHNVNFYLVDIGVYDTNTKTTNFLKWPKDAKSTAPAQKEPEVVEVSDDDLPF